jgi:hypothetical protein
VSIDFDTYLLSISYKYNNKTVPLLDSIDNNALVLAVRSEVVRHLTINNYEELVMHVNRI